jgi:hypothetical protein
VFGHSDHGGTISYDEFLGWFIEGLPVIKLEKELSKLNITDEQGVRDLFQKYDEDCSGELEIDELSKIVTALRGGIGVKPSEVRAALKAMDEDGGGTIDEQEFVSWWMSTDGGKVLRPTSSMPKLTQKRASVHAFRASLGLCAHTEEGGISSANPAFAHQLSSADDASNEMSSVV